MNHYGDYFSVHTANSGMHWSTDTAYVPPPKPALDQWADDNDLDAYIELAVMVTFTPAAQPTTK